MAMIAWFGGTVKSIRQERAPDCPVLTCPWTPVALPLNASCTAMLFTPGLSNAEMLIYGCLISGIVLTMMLAFTMQFMHKATKVARPSFVLKYFGRQNSFVWAIARASVLAAGVAIFTSFL